MPGPSSSDPPRSDAGGADLYDVVVAGASFAGLALAQALGGPQAAEPLPRPRPRILLLDRQPIGEGVTSACAAPARLVEAMGAAASIVQRHDALVIHTPRGRTPWPLPEPFVTFDYRRFCLDAAARAGVGALGGIEFRLASVRGRDGDRVLTSAGAVRGRILVDATGPRAALSGPSRPRYVAFGLESEVPRSVEPGLHFHFVPEIRDGYAWAFPAGPGTRFGVLSYRGRTRLLPALERFMARFGARPDGIHGGFLATGWTPRAADAVFAVGDAAGHCLPLSGEGIRTAVRAAARCGWLVGAVLDGGMSLDEARTAYRAFIAADRRRYRGLLWGNLLLLGLPQGWLGRAAAALGRPAVLRWFLGQYLRIFDERGSVE